MYFFSPLGISTEGMPTNSSNKPNIRGITQVALLTPELSSLLLFVWNKPSNRRREVTVVDKLQWSTIVFDTALINILCCRFFFPKCVVIFFPFLSPAVPLKPTNWFDEWWVSERDALADARRLPQQGGRSFEKARSEKKCHTWNKCRELVAINGSDGWGFFFLVVAVVATTVNFQLNGGLAVHAQS